MPAAFRGVTGCPTAGQAAGRGSHKHVNRPLAPRRAGRILATFVGDRTWHIAMNRPEQVSKHVNQATRAMSHGKYKRISGSRAARAAFEG